MKVPLVDLAFQHDETVLVHMWTCFVKVESVFGFTRPASRIEAG